MGQQVRRRPQGNVQFQANSKVLDSPDDIFIGQKLIIPKVHMHVRFGYNVDSKPEIKATTLNFGALVHNFIARIRKLATKVRH